MKNLSSSFNRFSGKALILAVSDFVMRRSLQISSVGYTFGNGAIAAKDFLQAVRNADGQIVMLKLSDQIATFLDPVGGLCFICSSSSLMFAAKNEKTALRACGIFGVAGGLCMALSALNLNVLSAVPNDNPINWAKMAGAAACLTISTMAGLKDELTKFSRREIVPKAKTIFNRAAQGGEYVLKKFTCRPLIGGAAVDAVATVGFTLGAMIQPDPGMIVAMAAWVVGAGGLAISDDCVQASYKKARAKTLAPV